MKLCTRCLQPTPDLEFAAQRSRNGVTVRGGVCRNCINARRKEKRLRRKLDKMNMPRLKRYVEKERYHRRRREVCLHHNVEHGTCDDCGLEGMVQDRDTAIWFES